mmetsp:Transcript_26005/g.46051  ORF Transcript_26005/g.46051 Transcript_26005/m.46051 type:complete len:540 (+) Transcript_26005:2253-3872(+)
MFLAEGWPEAAPELQLDRFVLEVLKELNNLVAPPILSKKFVRSLLTASKEVPAAPEALNLIRENWRDVDPELLLLLQKSGGEPLNYEEVKERAFDLWRVGNHKKAVALAVDFQFRQNLQANFDAIAQLVKADKVDLLLRFIEDDADLSREAVNRCTTNKHIKIAGKIIQNAQFNPTDFPEVINRMKKNSMRYFLNSKEFGLPELIDLVEDDLECLGIVIEDLEFKCFKKHVTWMGELAAYLLRKYPKVIPFVRPNIVKKLSSMPESDRAEPQDFFGPSDPSYLTLAIPEEAVKMIDTEEKVSQLEWSYPIYGLDCEWRPNLIKFESFPVSIFTIACENEVYIVDMLALKDCALLDAKLQILLSSPSIIKVGMSFAGDLKMLRGGHPHFECFKEPMNAYADLLDGYKAVFSNQSPGGLAGICQTLLGKPLCKVKQQSNWNRRPLRRGQLHYAALDGHVQIRVWQEIERLMHDQGGTSVELLANLGSHSQSGHGTASGKKCKNCGTKGHAAKKCPKGPKCQLCSEFGHIARNCQSFKASLI